MMAKKVTCDKCGTDEGVKEAFLTVWNGNVVDLCQSCARPMFPVLDALNLWGNR